MLSFHPSQALDAICQSCRDHIEQHFDGLMQITASLDSFSISNEAVVGLLKGVASILGRLPRSRIKDDMRQLCLLQITSLGKLIEVGNIDECMCVCVSICSNETMSFIVSFIVLFYTCFIFGLVVFRCQDNIPPEKNTKNDPVVWLDRLAAIFRNVNPTVQNGEQHPCQEVVMEVRWR